MLTFQEKVDLLVGAGADWLNDYTSELWGIGPLLEMGLDLDTDWDYSSSHLYLVTLEGLDPPTQLVWEGRTSGIIEKFPLSLREEFLQLLESYKNVQKIQSKECVESEVAF